MPTAATARPIEAEVIPPGHGPVFPLLRLPSGWAPQMAVFVLGVAAGIGLCWVIKHKL